LRPFSQSNPQAFAGRTFRLNRLLVPPNEGPASVDATFQAIGQEAEDREAGSGRAVEGEPAPERPAADDFWSNYEAGY
jgi:hypothetical protein